MNVGVQSSEDQYRDYLLICAPRNNSIIRICISPHKIDLRRPVLQSARRVGAV